MKQGNKKASAQTDAFFVSAYARALELLYRKIMYRMEATRETMAIIMLAKAARIFSRGIKARTAIMISAA